MAIGDTPPIGFIGFGEAGFNIAMGLRAAGVLRLFAYDINADTPKAGPRIRGRATESETRLVATSAEITDAADILLSTVTADAAVDAAKQTAPFLEPRHFYADLNSVSPSLKQSIAALTGGRGARFVEGAIMAAVPPHRHRVPILLGGPAARALFDLLAPLGMRLEVVSDEVGPASAIKMCRSIVIKGLEALLFECVLGASRYGADERVFESVAESIPGIDWKKLADYMVGRVVEHGERRAREMEEVAETLRAIEVDPIMAEAAARRQQWAGRLHLLESFGGKAPKSYREVLAAIAATGAPESHK
jgi:3-hydroxyisobutyrate dehydrogenase